MLAATRSINNIGSKCQLIEGKRLVITIVANDNGPTIVGPLSVQAMGESSWLGFSPVV
jgi:hypothetical protein